MASESKPQKSRRAGVYIQQPAGYRAFLPAALPPDPGVVVGPRLLSLLSRADQALGRLDGSVQILPDADLFVLMYIRKEAVLSSQIEGTQSSLDDLLAAEAEIFTADSPKDVDEVLNYVAAMKHGLDRLQTLPLSIALILEIHERLLRGVRGRHHRPGELRRSQNWIGLGGAPLSQATFIPPPPDSLMEHLGAWELYLHAKTDLPMLIHIGLLHSQFETIHPFLDGNGRVGRLLITFLLCHRGILREPVLYLSHYFKLHREEYYRRLQAVRDDGDWEGWLEFFVEGVVEVAGEATETAKRIIAMREHIADMIQQDFGRVAGQGMQVLKELFRRPIIKVKDVQDFLDTGYQNARKLISRFVDRGILREVTDQARNRRFRFHEYIDLFNGG